jgi:hypothetical protein
MFIHFNSVPDSTCDNCETSGTIMHISVERLDHALSLCAACFTAMFRVFSVASQKLNSQKTGLLEPRRALGGRRDGASIRPDR